MKRIFDFNKRFGGTIDPEEVKRDFLNKINFLLIEPLDKRDGSYYSEFNSGFFDFVAMEFNENPTDIIGVYNRDRRRYSSYEDLKPSFEYFSRRDFTKTLLLIEVFYDYFSGNVYDGDHWTERIDKVVAAALNQPISLGVSWRDGKFYPEGAEEFDEKLVSEVLKWLEEKPKIQALFKNALDHYSGSISNPIKRKDVISNSFQAVEKLTQEYLESPKPSFDNNFNALVDKLDLEKEWKKIFNSYKELSKEFGRHAGSDDDFIPNQEDTEAFFYLSGLIIRLILEKSRNPE
jgi:hypothetical protein